MAKIFTLEQRILKRNSEVAEQNRRLLDSRGVYAVSLASSPGSGKTTLLEKCLKLLREQVRVGVIEGDVQTDRDAQRIEALGVPVVQIVTNGTCHLDAAMVEGALEGVKLEDLDLLLIENVGNLVCPASYDLGEHLRVVLSSITEGEDKPLKYPAMYRRSRALVLTKLDLLPHLRYDLKAARAYALRVNPSLEIFETSSFSGEGIEKFCRWLLEQMADRTAA